MVNQLPQGWKEEELGNLVDIFDNLRKPVSSTERLLRIKNKDKSELYPYYGATGLVDYIDGYIFDGEYLLLGEDGCPFLEPLKDKAYIISGKTWVNNHAHVLRAKESKTSNKFLLYYLNKFDYNGIVSGATRLKLNQNSMKKIPVCYPTDKDEQEYIVKTLDAVAEMIKLRKETIQLTKDLIPAIFQEMFGDCSENVLIGNNDYFEIEDGDRGNNYPKKEELLEKGDCLFLSAKNVTEDGFVFKENVFISQDKDKKLRTGKLKRHDFVMMTRGTIGNIAYYSPDIPYDNIRINSGMVIIRIKQGFEPLYFLQAMRSDNIKFQINNLITGAAVPQLPIHLIKKISLKLADNTKQKEFADKLEQINQNLEVQQKDLDRLQELFDQLLQKAFTGELTRGEDYGKH